MKIDYKDIFESQNSIFLYCLRSMIGSWRTWVYLGIGAIVIPLSALIRGAPVSAKLVSYSGFGLLLAFAGIFGVLVSITKQAWGTELSIDKGSIEVINGAEKVVIDHSDIEQVTIQPGIIQTVVFVSKKGRFSFPLLNDEVGRNLASLLEELNLK